MWVGSFVFEKKREKKREEKREKKREEKREEKQCQSGDLPTGRQVGVPGRRRPGTQIS